MICRSLWFSGPREVRIQKKRLGKPTGERLLVQSHFSAISAGTELLAYRGEIPADLAVDENIKSLPGTFSFPFRYGYSLCGEVIGCEKASRQWQGRKVFSFHPHEDLFIAGREELIPVPGDISPLEAAWLPSMETAIHLLQEGKPLVGEKAAVLGQGVIGLFVTGLLARMSLKTILTLDKFPLRRRTSLAMGAHASLDPSPGGMKELPEEGADLVYELTGNPAALDMAVSLAGRGGRVIVGSWYGTKQCVLNLGAHFHRSRIRITSSQVSRIPAGFTLAWDKPRRLELAWDMLRQIRPGPLITHRFAFEDAPRAYELLDRDPAQAIGVVFDYKPGKDPCTLSG